jgi:hypothetical protein
MSEPEPYRGTVIVIEEEAWVRPPPYVPVFLFIVVVLNSFLAGVLLRG